MWKSMPPVTMVALTLLISIICATGVRALYRRTINVTWSSTVIVSFVSTLAGATIGTTLQSPYLDGRIITICGTILGTVFGLSLLMKINNDRIRSRTLADVPLYTGENHFLEFKSTARYNLRLNRQDDNIEHSLVKAIAGFRNADGGIVLVGVNDKGRIRGISEDLRLCPKPTLDSFELSLRDTFAKYFGVSSVPEIFISFDVDSDTKHKVAIISVQKSRTPVFITYKNIERFYVRLGNSTHSLSPSEMLKYLKHKKKFKFYDNKPIKSIEN